LAECQLAKAFKPLFTLQLTYFLSEKAGFEIMVLVGLVQLLFIGFGWYIYFHIFMISK
jgi:hypothetical protein